MIVLTNLEGSSPRCARRRNSSALRSHSCQCAWQIVQTVERAASGPVRRSIWRLWPERGLSRLEPAAARRATQAASPASGAISRSIFLALACSATRKIVQSLQAQPRLCIATDWTCCWVISCSSYGVFRTAESPAPAVLAQLPCVVLGAGVLVGCASRQKSLRLLDFQRWQYGCRLAVSSCSWRSGGWLGAGSQISPLESFLEWQLRRWSRHLSDRPIYTACQFGYRRFPSRL
jgi:hypothetical protein